jgi:hypothetical protein
MACGRAQRAQAEGRPPWFLAIQRVDPIHRVAQLFQVPGNPTESVNRSPQTRGFQQEPVLLLWLATTKVRSPQLRGLFESLKPNPIILHERADKGGPL